MWTQFWDMHSGGPLKEKWSMIYIEAPEREAKVIFYNRFGHNPDRVSCTCCGGDYSINENASLTQLTGYHRNCVHLETPVYKSGPKKGLYKTIDDPAFHKNYYLEKDQKPPKGYSIEEKYKPFGRYMTLAKYKKLPSVLIISKKDIKKEEREGDLPEQGYVWRD